MGMNGHETTILPYDFPKKKEILFCRTGLAEKDFLFLQMTAVLLPADYFFFIISLTAS